LRLLILNGDLPIFPGQAGHEFLHTTRLAHAAERVGLVSLLHTQEQDESKGKLTEARVGLYLWRSPHIRRAPLAGHREGPGWLRRVGEALYNAGRNWRRRPSDTLIQDLQFRNIAGPLLEALSHERWQALVVVQSNCARWLDYVPRFPVSVLVMHDVRALVYERQIAAARSARERWACRREARRYRRFERTYCRRFDLVITVSPADEAFVRRHYKPRRVVTVTIPVDRGYFAPMRAIRERPARIMFTGMMAHPPNVDAARFFAREVLPQVQTRVPEAEFWIVGRDPAPSVRELVTCPGVVVTGFVPDMRPYLAQAGVVVVPLRFGSGMRNKILEAWAMEKCVVSTAVGAEGLDHQDGQNILLADDAQGLADRVVDAIRDPELRDRVRAQGRALVSSSHDPDTLARRYGDAISEALGDTVDRDRPLSVVIDLRWMRPGVAGGIENLSRSFLEQLLRLDWWNHYTVLVPAEAQYDFDARGHSNVTFLPADGLRVAARTAAVSVMRLLHRRLGLQYWRTPEVETLRSARAVGAEVALSVPGYIHPDLTPLANVLIMPDIQHEYCPEFFSPRELEERRRLYTQSAQRAAHICAISEFTRQTLIERLGISPDRVTTTHLAADPIFHTGSPARENPQRVLAQYRLKPRGYLLFPGHTWPHKNHATAIEALRVLREAYGLEPLLVCTGGAKGAQGDLSAKIQQARLEGRVRFLGYCPSTDMPALYENAAALVFPSLFEGFGIPLLEAMWCDCPIVCSGVTSLPEIAGDAAVLVDPRSPEELAHAVRRVLTDEAERRRLIERGRQRVKQFSWTKFTLEIVSVLRRVRELHDG
jgi:glycosyltransferase involved in cell wall biosynthesis